VMRQLWTKQPRKSVYTAIVHKDEQHVAPEEDDMLLTLGDGFASLSENGKLDRLLGFRNLTSITSSVFIPWHVMCISNLWVFYHQRRGEALCAFRFYSARVSDDTSVRRRQELQRQEARCSNIDRVLRRRKFEQRNFYIPAHSGLSCVRAQVPRPTTHAQRGHGPMSQP
jgi:hypothetical protein